MNRIRHDKRYTTHGNSLVERCIELIIWLVEILGLSLVKLSKEGLDTLLTKNVRRYSTIEMERWLL